ncbi:ParA family protein [Rhizobiaceae bacterium]|nr:ParA family protein [Rhizobiaceae bacterium]
MPPIITFAARKGGVGKSSLTIALAGWLMARGIPVAILDTDPQGTIDVWRNLRLQHARYPLVTDAARTTPHVLSALRPLEIAQTTRRLLEDPRYRHGVIIIDTPPKMDPSVEKAIGMSDLVLVPARACAFDCESVEVTIETARRARLYCVVVLTMVQPDRDGDPMHLVRTARRWLEENDVDVADETIVDRVAWQRAAALGFHVSEFEAYGRAALEIDTLARAICQGLGIVIPYHLDTPFQRGQNRA